MLPKMFPKAIHLRKLFLNFMHYITDTRNFTEKVYKTNYWIFSFAIFQLYYF